MQPLIIASLFSALVCHYLAGQGWLPRPLVFIPELLAAVAAAVVVLAGIRDGFRHVRPAYWLVFGALGFLLLGGVFANQVEPGPVVAGARHYLRALPFLLLPAVLLINDRKLKVQLLVVLAIALLQLPLAWEQRMESVARGSPSGDYTFGTLMTHNALSAFLISCACVLTAFFLRKRISGRVYFPLLVIVLLPTMLNETKGTLIVAPLAILTVFLLGAEPGTRVKNTVMSLAVICVFVGVFIPVYDHFMKPRWGYGIVDFFTMEGRVEGYLDRGAEIGDAEVNPGKVGSLRLAMSELRGDPVRLVFGVGLGNASDSALGPQFNGRHHALYDPFLETSLVLVLVELGIGGLVCVLLLIWLLFQDSRFLAKSDTGMTSTLALGWTGVIVTMSLGMAWFKPIDSISLSVLFWHFSGVLSAHRMRVVLSAQARSRPPLSSEHFRHVRHGGVSGAAG